MDERPLADRMRPKSLDELVGQKHLTDNGKIIREIVSHQTPVNIILWGPPGSGKTTIARIIANETKSDFVEISAVAASKKDVTNMVEKARLNLKRDIRTILFVDEIHRFNKAQQDAFLPHVENGTITLIGATTENPSFEIINPLLSRSRVLVLEPLTKADIVSILKTTAKKEKLSAKRLPAKSVDLIAELSGGDARVAIGTLELAIQLTKEIISSDIVTVAAQKQLPGYDKKGDYHYNLISAFIKSMRGGDVDATLYYMARMLQAGEDPKFIARRMVIFASEDVGLAAPATLNLAVSTFLAVERIGLPEAKFALFECAIVLAKTNKSRSVAGAMMNALNAADNYPDSLVPLHLRNAPTKLMKELGYQENYEWKAGFQHSKGFLPTELKDLKLFKQ
ncbi:MAG TPA: replication-associated recombination protein A [Candidatus Saccharimonadales bacterium]|jgi:putative ATPase|nr:replication-associated recombination protein A [Candidatus Saccharimonadales bacterium]